MKCAHFVYVFFQDMHHRRIPHLVPYSKVDQTIRKANRLAPPFGLCVYFCFKKIEKHFFIKRITKCTMFFDMRKCYKSSNNITLLSMIIQHKPRYVVMFFMSFKLDSRSKHSTKLTQDKLTQTFLVSATL